MKPNELWAKYSDKVVMYINRRVRAVVVVTILALGITALIIWGSFSYQAKANYTYTLDDMYYTHYADDVIFGVSVNHIYKEKNKNT